LKGFLDYQALGPSTFLFFSSGLVDEDGSFYFSKINGYESRLDEHGFGFSVEKRIYDLFVKLGFAEIVSNDT